MMTSHPAFAKVSRIARRIVCHAARLPSSQGRKGTIEGLGCEGGYLYSIGEEGGPRESDEGAQPEYTSLRIVAPANDHEKMLQVPGAPHPSSHGPDDDSQHLLNWLHTMRDRRDPNANVDHGFSHAIVCIMASQSYWTGKRLYWDPKREEIVNQPVPLPRDTSRG